MTGGPFTDGRERRPKLYPVSGDEMALLVICGAAFGVCVTVAVGFVVAALASGLAGLVAPAVVAALGVIATAITVRRIGTQIARETTFDDD